MIDDSSFAIGGRRIGYARYGDPGGIPVAYCHGLPSSRLEAKLAARTAGKQGILLFAPDRPGYGRSDPMPPRSIATWPEDLAALADHLGISRFHVLGVSGGSPYALACGWRLRARVAGIALACPLASATDPGLCRPMSPAARLAFYLARRAPWALPLFFGNPTARLLRRHPQWVFALLERGLPEKDRQALADPAIRGLFEDTVVEGLRQGAHGALRDFIHYVRPWNFDPASIPMPVTLWHGDADTVVPATHSRYLSRLLPRAECHILPEEGHYSLPTGHSDAILAHLTATS